MKKIIGILLIVSVILSFSQIVFAGSIPEDLLHSDEAEIFFAYVSFYHPDKEKPYIQIVPTKVIKGDLHTGGMLTYYNPNTVGNFNVKPGNVYLFTYFDENNPTDIFEVTSYDTASLKLKNTNGDMWKRFEKYLNEGKYEKAQKERIDRINEALTLENGEKIALSELLGIDEHSSGEVSFQYTILDARVIRIEKQKFYEIAKDIICTQIETSQITNRQGLQIRTDDFKGVYVSVAGRLEEYHPSISYVGQTKYKISSDDLDKLMGFVDELNRNYPPLKSNYAVKILLISVSVLFASGFVAGFIIMKKRKGNKTK